MHSTNRWMEVRDTEGRLLFKFDPERDLIEIGSRGRYVVVDLTRYRAFVESIEIVTNP